MKLEEDKKEIRTTLENAALIVCKINLATKEDGVKRAWLYGVGMGQQDADFRSGLLDCLDGYCSFMQADDV